MSRVMTVLSLVEQGFARADIELAFRMRKGHVTKTIHRVRANAPVDRVRQYQSWLDRPVTLARRRKGYAKDRNERR